MSPYEELVERCANACCVDLATDDLGVDKANEEVNEAWLRDKDDPARERLCSMARVVLAEVFSTLENVTPEMVDAYADETLRPERGSNTSWATARLAFHAARISSRASEGQRT